MEKGGKESVSLYFPPYRATTRLLRVLPLPRQTTAPGIAVPPLHPTPPSAAREVFWSQGAAAAAVVPTPRPRCKVENPLRQHRRHKGESPLPQRQSNTGGTHTQGPRRDDSPSQAFRKKHPMYNFQCYISNLYNLCNYKIYEIK